MIRIPTLCRNCVRLRRGGVTCEAFPRGIPDEIVRYGGDHTVPIPGDRGITFKPRSGAEVDKAVDDWKVSHS